MPRPSISSVDFAQNLTLLRLLGSIVMPLAGSIKKLSAAIESKMNQDVHIGVVEYSLTIDSPQHTHTLDDIDQYKVNNAIKTAIENELKNGYSTADKHKHFMPRGRDGAYDAVEAAKLVSAFPYSVFGMEHML